MVQSINPPGVPHHKNPIPAAAVHRGVLVSSAIFGMDPQTGQYPADDADQVALAFKHMQLVLEAGGASLQDVVKVDLFFRNTEDRVLANPHWLELFPDENHRPARHAHVGEMPGDCCLQIVVMAVLESQKQGPAGN